MDTSNRTALEITREIGNFRQDLKTVYFRALACGEYCLRLQREVIISASCGWPDDVDSISGHMGFPSRIHHSPDFSKLSVLIAIHETLLKSPEFLEASEILTPLLAEQAEAVAREGAAAQAIAQAEQNLADAKEAARQRLEAQMAEELLKDPGVIAAQSALPAPPAAPEFLPAGGDVVEPEECLVRKLVAQRRKDTHGHGNS